MKEKIIAGIITCLISIFTDANAQNILISKDVKEVDILSDYPFQEGLSLYHDVAFFNKKGEVVIKLESDVEFLELRDWGIVKKYFSDGLGPVKSKRLNKIGFINKKGELVIPYKYDDCTHFANGFAFVKQGESFYLINKQGEKLGTQSFNGVFGSLTLFDMPHEGFVKARYFDKKTQLSHYYVLDSTGKEVFQAKFIGMGNFFEGLAKVSLRNELNEIKWGFINRKGDIVIEPIFSKEPGDFKHDRSRVIARDGKIGYIDKRGELVIETKFKNASDFFEGFAFVSSDRYDGLIDTDGKFVYKFAPGESAVFPHDYGNKFRENLTISEGLFIIKKGNKYGMKNTKGETIIEPIYENLKPFSDGLAYAEIDIREPGNRYEYKYHIKGFINKQGEFILVRKGSKF